MLTDQELLALAAIQFANANDSLFMEFLKVNNPKLYKIYKEEKDVLKEDWN